MSKAIAVAKPSIESVGAESHQPSPHATKSRKQKLIDAPRQSKHLPTRRPPSMIFSHGRLVSSRLSRRSHPDCRATAWIKRMLQGHLNYFAVSGNHPSLLWFFNEVRRLWLMSLRRRSQTARLSWEKFIRLVARFFPPVRMLHPLPCHRFDAKTRGRSPVR